MGAFVKEFNLMGHSIVIQDPAEAELATIALDLVNSTIERVQLKQPSLSPNQATLLALLEIAGTLVKDRQAIDQYRSELDRKCSLLMGELAEISRQRPESVGL